MTPLNRKELRLVERRETRLKALKDHIDAAIERGGSYSDEEIEKALASETDQ